MASRAPFSALSPSAVKTNSRRRSSISPAPRRRVCTAAGSGRCLRPRSSFSRTSESHLMSSGESSRRNIAGNSSSQKSCIPGWDQEMSIPDLAGALAITLWIRCSNCCMQYPQIPSVIALWRPYRLEDFNSLWRKGILLHMRQSRLLGNIPVAAWRFPLIWGVTPGSVR